VDITRRGRVVATRIAPEDAAAVHQMHGFMRGSVVLPPGFDPAAPVADAYFAATHGDRHGLAGVSPPNAALLDAGVVS